AKYNEAATASGGALGRYTTVSSLKDVVILTNDSMKTYLLDTKLANTYQVEGLDLSDRIISFDDMGGIWKVTADVTIANQATIDAFRAMGDHQIAIGDLVPAESVLTWDVSEVPEFAGVVTEVKPDTELFA